MHLKNGRSAGNDVYAQKGLLQGLGWPVGQKLVFDQMTAPAPETMDSIHIKQGRRMEYRERW
jgi:hypothetical protein